LSDKTSTLPHIYISSFGDPLLTSSLIRYIHIPLSTLFFPVYTSFMKILWTNGRT